MQLSNEDLVIRIQAGENDLISQLWDQVYRFIRQQARIHMRIANNAYGGAVGYEEDDLVQQSYFALLNAVKYYKADAGASFITILAYTLKGAFSTVRGRAGDAMSKAVSGDVPAFPDDAVTTVLDILPDTDLEERGGVEWLAMEDTYQRQLHETLEDCLSGLSSLQASVLRSRYYDGKTVNELAALYGCTGSNIGGLEHRGLERLYEERHINGLDKYVEENTDYYRRVGAKTFGNTRTSSVEEIVFRREQLAEEWLRKKYGIEGRKHKREVNG